MAKDKEMLDLETLPDQPTDQEVKEERKKNKAKAKKNEKKGPNRVARFFKEVWSELKKVEWPSMLSKKNESGVLKQTGMVLLFVFIFVVIVTCVDLGLTELLKLAMN